MIRSITRSVAMFLAGAGIWMYVATKPAGAAESADWPCFRGPNHDGISTESKWSPAALTNSKIIWKANVGTGYSSVAIKGAFLYTMGNSSDLDIVYCLKVSDGSQVWTNTYPCKGGDHPGPRVTPTIDEDRVYTLGREGQLLCLNAADGKIRWQTNLISDFQAQNIGWGFSASPRVHGDMLLLNAGQNGIALKKKTGEKIWATTGTGGYATPVIYKAGQKECAAIFGFQALYGVSLKDGKELWSSKWVTGCNVNAADPIVTDGKVFISSGYDRGCALLDISGAQPKELWQNKTMRNQFSSSVLIDGHIYGIDGNAGRGMLRCLELKTGDQKWEKDLGFGALMAANGKLIILNERGDLFIAEATTAGYKEISTAKGVLGKICWTAPVLCRGMIFCRNDNGDLVCVDVSK
jgi:outer membrane protein assembly factor BamB